MDVFLKMEGEGWVLCTKTAAAWCSGGCIEVSLSVDLGVIGSAEQIIQADMVKICQLQKGFRGWNTFTVLVFGKQCLFNAGFHLYPDLCIPLCFAELTQSLIHVYHPMTLCHILV